MSEAERFKRYDQDQGQLFPAHLSEGLDPGEYVQAQGDELRENG
jgi:hypothetical protein